MSIVEKVQKMHGRKKVPIDEARKIKQAQKAKKLGMKVEKILEMIKDPEQHLQLFEKNYDILVDLDDFATVWNLRKIEILKNEITPEVVERELNICYEVLRSNPKSYWAWHHRRWMIDRCEGYDCHNEVKLIDKLLDYDCRNFHAWRHRRWAVAKCGDLAESELEMTTSRIQANFSNFSAWHYRSQLSNLPDLKEEIEMIKSAVWTDSNDQSAWIYFRWILQKPEISSDHAYLQEQLEDMHSLIEVEPEAKYAYMAAIWIHRLLPEQDEAKISELVSTLSRIDPIRAPYYKEL